MRAPIGSVAKRGEEAPRSVETGVGCGAKTGRKCVFGVDVDRSRGDVAGAGEGLRIVFAAGSEADVMRTSFQP